MPVYPRSNSPYWWYTFSVGGRRFRGSTGETEERAARLIEAQKFHEANNARTHGDEWRLREVLGTYWSEHAQHLDSASTIFFQFELLSDFLGQDLDMKELTNALLMDYRAARRGGTLAVNDDMLERPKAWQRRMVKDGKVRAVAPQTVNRDLASLQAAITWAREVHGKQMPDIAWKRLKAKEAPHRIRFAAAEEFTRLMEAAHPDLRTIILCAVTTGLRRGNIFDLHWHQIDLDGSTITIPRTKSGKPHLVGIAPPLRAALARTPPRQRRGKVFDLTNIKRRWRQALKAAEMVDFRFHDLRHTFASWARQNGADLADICEALDHSSVAVTQRYAHIHPTETTTAFDRVAQLIESHGRTHSPKKTA